MSCQSAIGPPATGLPFAYLSFWNAPQSRTFARSADAPESRRMFIRGSSTRLGGERTARFWIAILIG